MTIARTQKVIQGLSRERLKTGYAKVKVLEHKMEVKMRPYQM